MTDKEKVKAYDDAIERAKKLYGNEITKEIFPELKESKDKKIRKAILNGLIDCRDAPDLGWSNFGGIHIDDCIDWLEKQCESDNNPNYKTISEYLYKEKGYPDSLNGYKYIATFKEIMKDVQIYNAYKEEQRIEKACNWLREQKEMIGISFQEDFIERFKMAMKK